MNSLMVIRPYRYHGAWVFDDPDTRLVREPFVSGADKIIDELVHPLRALGHNPDAGFALTFSASPFPGYREKLLRAGYEHGGTWYFAESAQMLGWLCPALCLYFPAAPKEIYAMAAP